MTGYNAVKVVVEFRDGTPTAESGTGAVERTYVGIGFAEAVEQAMSLLTEHGVGDPADIMRVTAEPRVHATATPVAWSRR